MDNKIIKTYDNGLRLVVEPMPGFQSVVFNMMVFVGSGDELPTEYGLSHFCEHMLFKGTTHRTGQQIIDELAQLGVQNNAWTSESATCYHTKGLAQNLPQCMDILSDMYFNLQFTPEDFDKEGNVILQEIAMHQDSPQSVLFDTANETFFKGTKYEHPVIGFAKDIKKYQPDDIYNYIKKHYTATNTIIALAGDITLEKAEALVKKYFLKNFSKTKAAPKQRAHQQTIVPVATSVKKKKDTEQQHVALLFPVCNQFDDDRYALKLLKFILGGDMSSRLFINVREKAGLVYSITSMLDFADIGGSLMIVFSCTPKNTKKVITIINQEIDTLLVNGITAAELAKAKNALRTSRLFACEKTMYVNDQNADSLREYGTIKTTADYLKKLDSLTIADINAVAQKYLDKSKMSTITVGK